MPKQTRMRVLAIDAEMEFSIEPETTGKQLVEQVARTLQFHEVWYFGLEYTDSKGFASWIKLSRKILSQDITKNGTPCIKFKVKYYPEDVSEELIQEVTQRLFYLQVKEDILNDLIFCPPETSVLLASYALQIKFGDYSNEQQKTGLLFSDRILPKSVLDQHKLNSAQWEERIVSWYSEHRGMLRLEAIMEYLKVAQDLDMYGVSYFEIANKKGTELLLGVDALGLNIYERADRLTPRIGFPWSEIRNVSFENKKFVIKSNDKKSPDFIFFASHSRINKHILALCMGNHELYMRRRRPDSPELTQLKVRALEERKAREAERAFKIERQQREVEERQRVQLEQELKKYEQEVRKVQAELLKSKEISLSMHAKVQQLENEQKDLQEARRHAEEARLLAEEAVNMEKAEKERREQEAAQASIMLEQKIKEAAEREAESWRLHEELERAKLEVQLKWQTLEAYEAEKRSSQHVVEKAVETDVQTWLINNGESYEVELQQSQPVLESLPDWDSSHEAGHDLPVMENVAQPELTRLTQAEKNQKLNEQLKRLSAELATAKEQTRITRNDVIHMQNVAQGRDKYKTLKQIRQGNTKQRVDVFEAM